MNAPTLFDLAPAPLPARASDPETSRAAARSLRLKDRKREVMEAISALARFPLVSFTTDDVQAALRAQGRLYERGTVASRMSQLANDGLIVRSGVAVGASGRDVTTWRLTPEGREWIARAS